ncbi:MAG: YlxR family protein [Pseudobutyrivibrio sp.]|nr:YlxR family protein [Pseudobutyrivibrio sp.]
MDNKKSPMRKCIACGQMIPKNDLFRLCRGPADIIYDKGQKMQTRGAYLCKSMDCINLAIKKKSFNRTFKTQVSDKVIDELIMELENGSR